MLRHIERSDAELVAQAQAGARDAVDELLRRHYDRLYAVCRRVAGNDADAADACQEALMSIVRGLPKFDGRSSFKTWSYRVATNACLDELRRRNRRPVAVAETPEPVGDDPSFEDRFTEQARLDTALKQLPEEFRLPVVLRDVGGLDYAEIAETLDIPPGTVRSRIARGRRHLAGLLTQEQGLGGNGDGNSHESNRKFGGDGNQRPIDRRHT
jgi:RNA polymerase sigma-70 factor (ECF subfamily)